MELTLTKDKTTPGTVRYADANGHNIYLKKDEAAALGNVEVIKVTVEPA